MPSLIWLQNTKPEFDERSLQRSVRIAESIVEECIALAPEGQPLPEGRMRAQWVLERMTGEHLCSLAAVLDCSLHRAHTLARNAVVGHYGLPQVAELAQDRQMAFDRFDFAAGRAHHLGDDKLGILDEEILKLRRDLSWKAYCKAVNDLIRMLTEPDDRLEDVHKRRRVEYWRSDDEEGRLCLIGPVPALQALHRRLEATARAIRKNHTSTFGEQLPPGTVIDDERTIPQLMFDLISSVIPHTPVQVNRTGPGGGSAGGEPRGSAAGDNALFKDFLTDVSGPASTTAGVSETVVLSCPTTGEWLRRQAAVVVTVPALTLTGHAELPGHWADGGPVPPELARGFASYSSKLYRVLTDPATGRVLDEAAKTYSIPHGLRITMGQKWIWCTAPGCTSRAETCEGEHLTPFNHRDPAAGGRTDLPNLHPMCGVHHQLKTEGKLKTEHGPDGMIRWVMEHGIIHEAHPADRPVDRAHARYFDAGGPGANPSSSHGTSPPGSHGTSPPAADQGTSPPDGPGTNASPSEESDEYMPSDPWSHDKVPREHDPPPF